MKSKRRGQEEIVGFVLIMIIVAVVFVVFLGISIRNDPGEATDSVDVYQFLESSMEYTTDCAFSSIPDYYSLGELFEECYSGNDCLEGGDTCEILNVTVNEILESSWNIDPEAGSNILGYEFVAEYVVNSSSQNEEIMSVGEGNCTGNIKGATSLTPAFPGIIEVSLKLCF
jgi:hypothetical protein